jgi:sentrin-specific protease 1
MFMIKYADFIARGLDLTFSQEDMPFFRRQTVLNILQGEDAAKAHELEH